MESLEDRFLQVIGDAKHRVRSLGEAYRLEQRVEDLTGELERIRCPLERRERLTKLREEAHTWTVAIVDRMTSEHRHTSHAARHGACRLFDRCPASGCIHPF
ncbi:hypothetical protein A9X06_05035 [Mycobacterium sp. 852002-51759_SCH5129042]|nr:hypothetical protein A9X06_05035 [Mycobacterium sp. 852002-51759_SCH5129042]